MASFKKGGKSVRAEETARGAQTLGMDVSATDNKAGNGLGIVVLGYNRPEHLASVLASLDRQGHIGKVHVWIDGTQGRKEFNGANAQSLEAAGRFNIRELHTIKGHLGIEKMMLDALDLMSARYDRLILLEDDCFPLAGSVEAFEAALEDVRQQADIYSVYGCHFGTEPVDEQNFTRFQGWGWAAHSSQIRKLLPELRELFLMNERAYLEHVAKHMTDDIQHRLDRTPGRDVLKVLQSFFSWDSATAFTTARHNLQHRRTERSVVVNTGIVPGIGHFCNDTPMLRKKPFNMITLDEAWTRYDASLSNIS